jgi:hypothetical protein
MWEEHLFALPRSQAASAMKMAMKAGHRMKSMWRNS